MIQTQNGQTCGWTKPGEEETNVVKFVLNILLGPHFVDETSLMWAYLWKPLPPLKTHMTLENPHVQ